MKRHAVQWSAWLAAAVLIAGCATMDRGPSDEAMVQSTLDNAMMALKAQDIETLSMYYADDFSSDQGGKADMMTFLQGAADGGFLDGMEASLDDATIEVMDGKAMAGPVNLEIVQLGPVVLNFELEKRDGAWMITSQTQE